MCNKIHTHTHTHIALKGKWELERQKLVWRVSELEAVLAQQGANEEHTNTEAEGAVRPALVWL